MPVTCVTALKRFCKKALIAFLRSTALMPNTKDTLTQDIPTPALLLWPEKSLLQMGNACLGTSHHALATKYLFESYEISESLGNHYQMSLAQMYIGVAYYLMENYEKSIKHYEKAIELGKKSGNLNKKSTLLYLTGIDYCAIGKYDLAHQSFFEALKLKTQEKDKQGVAECQVQLATMLLDQNKPDEALTYIEPALKYAIEQPSLYGISLTRNLIARAKLLQGQPEAALSEAINASLLADSIQSLILVKDNSYTLYQIYKELGEFNKAVISLEKYISCKDSIFNDKNSRLVSQIESQQLISEKQNEILLLEEEKKNRDLLLKGSVIIGLMFLLLFVVLYSRYVIRQRSNRQLSAAYDNLRKTQEQLISHEKMASLGQLTAGIAHEIKNPLNFVNNFSTMSIELIDELKSTSDEATRDALLTDLSSNLEKISKHGKRADSIVHSMLDHSRTGNSEKSLHDLNKLCSEYLNLSYLGLKAQKPFFSCEVESMLDPDLPSILIAGQEISRVLINIFNNAFYAVQKRSESDPDFKPRITLQTMMENGFAVIKIRDNGTGIPKAVKDKIFEPFFTTKPAGEGTGLGLSISYEIITSHGGQMEVDSEEGSHTQFIIKLPRG
jgi:two-component system, NtrC family, sensor kinase